MGLEEYLYREDVPEDIREAIKTDITERKQAEEGLRRKEREAALLAEASKTFNSTLDIQETFEKIAKLVSEEIGESCTIFRVAGKHLLPIAAFFKGKKDKKAFKILMENPVPLQESITGFSMENREPILIENTAQDQRFIPLYRQLLDVRSYLCVPLIAKVGVLGALSASTTSEGRRFDEDDLKLAVSLADRAAAALENSDLYDKARIQARRLSVVNEISRAVNSTLDIESVYQTIIEQLKRVLPFAFTANIALHHPEDDTFMFSYLYDPTDINKNIIETKQPYPSNLLMLSKAFKTKRTLYVRDAKKETPHEFQFVKNLAERGLRSALNLPLIIEQECIGTLNLGATHVDAFKEEEIVLLETVSSHLAIAIKNAKIHENLKSTQEQLMQVEKLSALGQLVSGVAHELNNPLSVILTHSELLLLDSDDKNRKHYETIIRNVRRCGKITNNLLSFTRELKPEKKGTPINDCIRQALDIISYHLTTDNIQVELDLDDELPETMVDGVQMQQVFLNIINNAQQALLEKGSPGKIDISTKRAGDDIVISFTDNGIGMDQATLSKAFDPFFTTKEIGKGTGLGLSVSMGIIRAHNGDIRVNSRPGEGTEVVISIPITQPEGMLKEAGASVDEKTFPQRKRVLIVDDEKDILDSFKKLFTIYNWETVTAIDGSEALAYISELEFDTILCDLKMPGMSGKELYEILRKEYPHTLNRIVIVTGDVVGEDTAKFLEETRVAYVSKPVDIAKLTRVLSAILTSSEGVPGEGKSRLWRDGTRVEGEQR